MVIYDKYGQCTCPQEKDLQPIFYSNLVNGILSFTYNGYEYEFTEEERIHYIKKFQKDFWGYVSALSVDMERRFETVIVRWKGCNYTLNRSGLWKLFAYSEKVQDSIKIPALPAHVD